MSNNIFIIKKLILKLSIQVDKIISSNSINRSDIYNNYCLYVIDVTNYYIKNKFNKKNANNFLLTNISSMCRNYGFTPTKFLDSGLDFNDQILREYFNELIF